MADNDFGLNASDQAVLEAENALRVGDWSREVTTRFLEPERPFRLTPSLILEAQQIACEGLKRDAGAYRTDKVSLVDRKHVPPPAFLVQSHTQEMCDYVNNNLHDATPLHLSAFIMWRLNWIHPFSDGNGRTSRTISYIVLSVRLGYHLPGRPTITRQIEEDRKPYFDALEEADEYGNDLATMNIEAMEQLLKGLLSRQLLSVIADGSGTTVDQIIEPKDNGAE